MFESATKEALASLENQPSTNEAVNEQVQTQSTELAPDMKFDDKQPLPNATDLSKLEKFVIDGKEWTFSDLKKAMMLQSDYTKKTQKYSEERKNFEATQSRLKEIESDGKFRDNLAADALSIAKNPQMLEEFYKIYPEKFHAQGLALVQRFMDELSGKSSAKGEQTTQPGKEFFGLEQRLNQTTQAMNQLMQANKEAEQKAFNTQLVSIEGQIKSQFKVLENEKYFSGFMDKTYADAQRLLERAGINDYRALKEGQLSQVLMKCAKDNMEAIESMSKELSQVNVKKQVEANKKGQDIGRGGSTPSQAPTKMKLKDIADHIISSENI